MSVKNGFEQNKQTDNEIGLETSYIIAYDMPSENRLCYDENNGNREAKMKVRSTRIAAITKLHKLGLLCTESVILVPRMREKDIEKAIEHVNQLYEDLNKWLLQKGYHGIEKPLIKVIPLNAKQTVEFRDIAEKKLAEKLDETINRLSNLLDELDEIVDEHVRRKTKYNLNKQEKEIKRLQEIAKELGIDLEGKFELVFEFFREAKNKLL